MSLHPSLKIDMAGTQQRSVLSRTERIKDLIKRGLWSDHQEPTGLPKTKVIKIKTKKAKTKEEAQATATAPAAQAAAKPEAAKKSETSKKPEASKGKK